MLDRAKLMKELQAHRATLFHDNSAECDLALQVWNSISADPTLCYRVRTVASEVTVPSWIGPLNEVVSNAVIHQPYHVLSIDGSQIYPDRHTGVSCYLINIGAVDITYGKNTSSIAFSAEPHLFLNDGSSPALHGVDLVNAQRHAYELNAAVSHLAHRAANEVPTIVLFDGSLIFWHLEKDAHIKELFLEQYAHALTALYHARVPYASYISMPKSKDLTNIMRVALRHGLCGVTPSTQEMSHIVDAHVAHFFLQPYTRTRIFESTTSLCASYPVHSKPYFFYVHVDTEVARVEIPAWVAAEEHLVEQIMYVVIDQARKGGGYPVALAEAHEQAVIKGADRDFFYHCITRLSIDQRRQVTVSAKSVKKKYITI